MGMTVVKDFERFMQFLLEAGEKIEPHYFQIPIAGSGELKYRERVYSYELYHQLRIALGDDFPYKLDGEVDKEGHPIIHPTLGPKKPDLIVHKAGKMNRNLVVIEVKPIKVKKRGLEKDINTLKRFLGEAQYYRAIMLIYGDRENRSNIIQMAKNLIGDESRILLMWHRESGMKPVIVH
jgi:hypothetical protein